jgi:hypothetical protein
MNQVPGGLADEARRLEPARRTGFVDHRKFRFALLNAALRLDHRFGVRKCPKRWHSHGMDLREPENHAQNLEINGTPRDENVAATKGRSDI